MKKSKALTALILALAMALSSVVWVLASTASPVDMELVPVRQFFEEEVGAVVEWVPEQRAIVIAVDGGTIVLFANQTRAYVNDSPLTLQDGVTMIDSRAFLTMRDLMLLFDAFVADNRMVLELTEEARDIALADFDYLVNFTLANSAWDNIIYRRLGIDFDAHVAEHRYVIENMLPITVPYLPQHFPLRDCDEPESIAANYLINLLNFSFAAPFQGIGHLGVRDLTMYRMLLAVTQRAYHNPYATEYTRAQTRTTHGAYVDPRAIWFYGEYEFDLQGDDGGWPEVPGNIVTEILIPDEVAYLRINSFLTCQIYDNQIIFPFLQEVQDFDHLILDIRGNTGGDMTYFVQTLFVPLIREATHINSYQFFADGETAVEVMDSFLNLFQSLGLDEETLYTAIYPISDVVSQRNMTHFNQADYERLSYVFITRELTNPEAIPDEMRIPFEGEIWLLVDEMSMSASVAAAQLSISTGFATVVGTNTSGVTAGHHVYRVLPSTGIIWRVDIGSFRDDYGRSIEEFGVTPQVRNFPGMDALETVMTIISGEEAPEAPTAPAPVTLILTGRYGQGSPESNAFVSDILGGNSQERFNVYFNWFNTVHEIGHIVDLLLQDGTRPTGFMEGELFANAFAAAFWARYGDAASLATLRELVSHAVMQLESPLPEGEDIFDFARRWEAGELEFDFATYGWFQFNVVYHVLNEMQDLESLLAYVGLDIGTIPPARTLNFASLGEDAIPEILAAVFTVLSEWGVEMPGEIYHTLSNDPHMHMVMTIPHDMMDMVRAMLELGPEVTTAELLEIALAMDFGEAMEVVLVWPVE